MSVPPKPQPLAGQIINYDYLWDDEARKGRIEGAKDRPCAVIVAIKSDAGANSEVLVCPITHTEPVDGTRAMPLPPNVARHSGLDNRSSWVITGEMNRVSWSDAGIIPARGNEWTYGNLPRGYYEEVREHSLNSPSLAITDRTVNSERDPHSPSLATTSHTVEPAHDQPTPSPPELTIEEKRAASIERFKQQIEADKTSERSPDEDIEY